MKSKIMLPFMLLACCWAGNAMANGTTLLQQCQDALTVVDGGAGKSAFAGGVCLGKIEGTLDGLEMARGYYSSAVGKTLSPLICWPKEPVSKEQQLRIVVKYLKDHPETLHDPEASSITLAMAFAFPCKKL